MPFQLSSYSSSVHQERNMHKGLVMYPMMGTLQLRVSGFHALLVK
ncbi:hypothetical protein SLEP1_g11119 [Rubroshorea leprosula]|uniref:Uncharacterized protein n=1 Tax=Rubroshorea leprosula TaxID=152421 RepID=A0AAV5IG53_9ROSI|nr:hypothetical protein SLEP1_g11119 [Rubroshorea leprosula]